MKLYHNALPLLGLLSLSAAPLAAQQSAPPSAPSPAPAAAQDAAPRPKLIVVISIDQFSGNLFEEYRQTYAMGMKRLANGVVFPSGYQSHAATETCPGHSTITTGARPARTGIIANEWVDQGTARQDKTVYCAEDETVPGTNSGDYAASNMHLRVPTLGERMKAANPATRVVSVAGKDRAAIMMGGHNVDQLWWWGGNGFVSYRGTAPSPLVAQVNAGVMKLLGKAQPGLEVPAQCASRDRAIALGGGKTVGTGHFARAAGDAKAFRASPEADAAVLVLATSLIEQMQLGKQAQTDIITIGLSANDYIGHTYGPGGAEMCIQQAQLDQSLGEFFARLDKDGVDYMVMLTADHGGLDLPERARENGAADAQRLDATLAPAAVNAALEKATGIKGPLLMGGPFGDYWLSRALSPADRAKVQAATVKWLSAQPQVQTVFTGAQIAASPAPAGPPDTWTLLQEAKASYDPQRSGDLIVLLKPRVTPIVDPTKGYVSTHGSPWIYDRRVPILFWWKGASAFEQPLSIETVDIAPTLASIVKLPVKAGEMDGRCVDIVAGPVSNCP